MHSRACVAMRFWTWRPALCRDTKIRGPNINPKSRALIMRTATKGTPFPGRHTVPICRSVLSQEVLGGEFDQLTDGLYHQVILLLLHRLVLDDIIYHALQSTGVWYPAALSDGCCVLVPPAYPWPSPRTNISLTASSISTSNMASKTTVPAQLAATLE